MLTSGLRFALRIHFDLVPIQMIIRLGCPRFVARCGLAAVDRGWGPESRCGQRAARIWHLTRKLRWRRGLPLGREASCPGKAGAVRKDEGDSMKRSWTA